MYGHLQLCDFKNHKWDHVECIIRELFFPLPLVSLQYVFGALSEAGQLDQFHVDKVDGPVIRVGWVQSHTL